MAFDYNGDWKNQLGATMSLRVNGGVVSGSFRSPVQDQDSAPPPKPTPVTGFVRNDVIVFCNTFAAGMGTMLGQPLLEEDQKDRFQTWWHFRAFDDPKPVWESVRTGCDTFERSGRSQ